MGLDRRRVGEYGTKAAHFVLRELGQAPEQRHARRLDGAVPEPADDAPRVLIFSLRDWALHVQWEAVMAQALRVRGVRVHVATCGGGLGICDRSNTWEAPPMPCRTCSKYVDESIDAHRLPRTTLRSGWEQEDPGDWPEVDEMTLAEMAHVEIDGLPLGQLCEIPVAWFLLRTDYHLDPIAPRTWREYLRSARRIAAGVRAVIDNTQPDTVVLLNGLFLFEAIAWSICRERGIDVVTYERGFIKETMLFRRNEVAASLRLDDIWPRFADLPLTTDEATRLDDYLEDRRHGRRTIDRYWEDVEFTEPDASEVGRLVVMFPNITWDSAVIGQTVAYDTIQEWITDTIDYFAGRPNDRLIVRLHPAELKLPGKQTRESLTDFVKTMYPALPRNVVVIDPSDNTSSYPLMDACDVGLVFTSTAGLELALAGKPVVVAGRTHYREKGFTLDADSPEHYLKILDDVLDDPQSGRPDVDLARRYAYLFFFRTPIDSPYVVEHIPALARLTVNDLAELEPGRNAALDRICDGILGLGDFLPEGTAR
jgi:hypothetical protein